MPCEECENGKYKWGKTGSCTYDSVAECEADNKDYYEDIKTTSIVELVISGEEELAIDAISLVTAPAIEQDFVFFGKEKNNLTLHQLLRKYLKGASSLSKSLNGLVDTFTIKTLIK
jgi:hypothetical protein